ncbi:hypothetical protein D3C72_1254150 [compost metagenome]
MVQARADDNHRTTVSFVSVVGEFTRDTGDLCAWHARHLLCPRRGIRFDVVVAGCTVFVVQTAFQTVVGHRQIVNGGHQCGRSVSQLQTFHRQFVQQDVFQLHFLEVFRTFAAEVRESDFRDIVLAAQHTEAQFGLITGGRVTLLEVPFAFFTPTETDGAVRRDHIPFIVEGDGFPFRVIFLAQRIHQIRRTQHTTRCVVAVSLFEHHQHWHVSVATHVVGEILAWFVEVEFTQHDVTHRQRHRGIGTLLRCQPQIAQFRDFGVVRRYGNGFGAFVTYFSKEVGVRSTGLRHVRAPGDDIAGVVPVRGFRNVSLFAPGLRRGWR